MTFRPKTKSPIIPGISNEHSKRILNIFQPLKHDMSLILFGSRAKGNFREGSDIDIAVQCPTVTLKDRDVWSLQYDDLSLPWKLDLVIYHLITEQKFIDHINRVGIYLLCDPYHNHIENYK
jgi:predicted nucleotidyltransferase